MKNRTRYQALLKEAENDLILLQKEASELRAAVHSGENSELELRNVKEEWFVKEQILRALATRNTMKCRNKIRELRIKLKSYIMQNKQAAKRQVTLMSCTTKGRPLKDILLDVKHRRNFFNRWLNQSPPSELHEAWLVHKQVFEVLRDIDLLVKKVQKISKNCKEATSLKKAIHDAGKFLESNQNLITHWLTKVSSSWGAMTQHLPQESLTNKNGTGILDIQSNLNSLNVPNDVLKIQKEISINYAYIKNSQNCNEVACQIIQNNCRCRGKKPKGSKNSSLDDVPTECLKMPVCKKNRADSFKVPLSIRNPLIKRRPNARKGTRYSFILNSKPVFNYKIEYITRGKSKNHPSAFAGSNEGGNINNMSKEINTQATLEDTTINIDDISKEYEVTTPISNFDDSSLLSVNIQPTENNLNLKKNCFFKLSDMDVKGQNVTNICASDKKNIDLRSNIRIRTPLNPSDVCPKEGNNLTVTSKQCSKQNKSSKSDVNASSEKPMTLHCSAQENCGRDLGSWQCANQLSQDTTPNDSNLQYFNWEGCMLECKIPSNDTITESTVWVYKNNHAPRNSIPDNMHACIEKQPKFQESIDHVKNIIDLSTASHNAINFPKNAADNNRKNNSVQDFEKQGYDVDFLTHLGFL